MLFSTFADNPAVGQLINLTERFADRSRPSASSSAFIYSLDCPLSYLMSERVERALGDVEWIPVVGPLSESSGLLEVEQRKTLARERLELAQRDELAPSVALMEPYRYPMDCRHAARAAVWARANGGGAKFALAIARMGFCGGFNIADDEVIGDAAAVSGLSPDQAIEAARDYRHDYELEATTRGLQMRGIPGPPVIRVGARWFHGADAIEQALSAVTP